MRTIYHVVMIEGCNCGNDCGGSTVYIEGNNGFTEDITKAKEYLDYNDASLAIEDYCAFFINKPNRWFSIQKHFRP